jgi:hypothetical protein
MPRYIRLPPSYDIHVPVIVCDENADGVEILTPQGARRWVPKHDAYPCRGDRRFM